MNSNWKTTTLQFLTAQTVSLFGSSLVQYAIIWYITLHTSSGTMMTIATICGYAPQIVVSLFAGVWLDRYDRKKLMMLADAAIAGATLFIALLFFCGFENIWLLFGVLIVRSAGTGVQAPAVNAFLPQIVPKEFYMKVNGINSALTSLTAVLSPALSGLVLSFLPLTAALFIDVATAVLGISMMFFVKTVYKEQDLKQTKELSVWEDMKQGFAYIRKNIYVKKLIFYFVVVSILVSPSAFLTPLLVSRTFGHEIWRLTLSEMTFSMGAVVGGMLIATWGGFKNRVNTIFTAGCFYAAMMIGIGLSSSFMVYLLFNGLIGISMPVYNAPINVVLQERVDTSMYGRVFGMVQVANATALPVGTILFGPAADKVSVQGVLLFAGSSLLLFSMAYWRKWEFFKDL